jgi:hypothetical protein
MSKQTVIIILGLFVLSCTGTFRVKKPDNLIPKDKMSEILYDLYTINSAKGVNRNLLEKNGLVPETYVLTKYNIDSTQFADSNTYYTYDNEEYSAIIEKVKAKLEKEKKALEEIRDTVQESKKSRIDSLKRLGKKTKDSIKKVIDTKGVKIDSLF